MKKCYPFIIAIVFLSIYASEALAAGADSPTGGPVVTTGTTTTSVPSGTASDLSTTSINQGSLNYPGGSFSSSFSGTYSIPSGPQCGFSIYGGYGRNVTSLNNNSWQIGSIFNTNPCVDQRKIETLRQKNETSREVIRANAQIIMTCINARTLAVQRGMNPDIICKLDQFQTPKNP